jgi:hypothetical protein
LKLTLFATSHHFVSLHLSPPFLFQICLEWKKLVQVRSPRLWNCSLLS